MQIHHVRRWVHNPQCPALGNVTIDDVWIVEFDHARSCRRLLKEQEEVARSVVAVATRMLQELQPCSIFPDVRAEEQVRAGQGRTGRAQGTRQSRGAQGGLLVAPGLPTLSMASKYETRGI